MMPRASVACAACTTHAVRIYVLGVSSFAALCARHAPCGASAVDQDAASAALQQRLQRQRMPRHRHLLGSRSHPSSPCVRVCTCVASVCVLCVCCVFLTHVCVCLGADPTGLDAVCHPPPRPPALRHRRASSPSSSSSFAAASSSLTLTNQTPHFADETRTRTSVTHAHTRACVPHARISTRACMSTRTYTRSHTVHKPHSLSLPTHDRTHRHAHTHPTYAHAVRCAHACVCQARCSSTCWVSSVWPPGTRACRCACVCACVRVCVRVCVRAWNA